jgi:hypothetical protein
MILIGETTMSDAKTYAELARFCGGVGGSPGPCPTGEDGPKPHSGLPINKASVVQGGKIKSTSRGLAIHVPEKEALRIKSEQGGLTSGHQVVHEGNAYNVTGRGERFQQAGGLHRYLYVSKAAG